FDVNCPTLRRYDRSAAVDKELAAFRSSLTKSVSGLPVRRFYQNCRGLRSKLVNLRCNATALDHIFIILSETWLTNGIFDNELGLHNYNIFRCDRSSLTSSLTLSNQLFSRG
ncbi:Reverse transcriptase domain-containing protein, partial [Aphis craccivora]